MSSAKIREILTKAAQLCVKAGPENAGRAADERFASLLLDAAQVQQRLRRRGGQRAALLVLSAGGRTVSVREPRSLPHPAFGILGTC